MKIKILAAIFFLLSGCTLTLNQQSTNADLFKNPSDLEGRTKGLKKDISPADVFQRLGLSVKQRARVSWLGPDAIYKELYGNSSLIPLKPEDFSRYSAFSLPYQSIHQYLEFHFSYFVVFQTRGFNESLVCVFRNGVLYKHDQQGGADIRNEYRAYIWSALPALFGTAVNKGSAAVVNFP